MANNIDFNIMIKANRALSQFRQLQKTAESTRKRFANLNRTMGQYQKSTNKVTRLNRTAGISFGSLTKQIALGNIAATAITRTFSATISAIKNAGSGAISSAANFEKLQAQMEVLTGSTKVAKDLFEDLVNFSAQTPFRLEDITKASQTLLAFGFNAEEVKEQVRTLGDVAGATNSKLPELARIIGQIQSAGKLTGERNLQLLERGINLYPELARVINVPEKELAKLQKTGKITFEQVNQALTNLTQEGGRFFQGTIRLAKTASGVFSTVGDNIQLVGASIGSKLLPFLKFAGIQIIEISKQVLVWVNNNLTLNKVLALTQDVISKFAVGLDFLNAAFVGVRLTVNSIIGVFNGLASGVRKTQADFYRLQKIVKEAATLGIADTSREDELIAYFDSAAQSSADLAQQYFDNNKKIIEDGVNTADAIANNAKRIREQLNAFVLDDGPGIEGATRRPAGDNADPRIEREKMVQDELLKLRQDAALAERELEVQKELESGSRVSTRLENLRAQFSEEEAIKFEARLREQEGTASQQATLLEIKASAARQEVQDRRATNKFLEDLDNELTQLQIDNAKKARDAKLASLQSTFSNTGKVLGAISSLMSANSKKQFRVTKALNVATAISNGIAAVTGAFRSPPFWPGNAAAVASVAASSAANVARASSQQAPAFENGGIVPGTGLTGDSTLARVNAREMILNRRQQSDLFNMINNGSTNINSNVVVEIDGEAIGKAVSKQVANGLQLGEVI